jgi:hypothetical protein
MTPNEEFAFSSNSNKTVTLNHVEGSRPPVSGGSWRIDVGVALASKTEKSSLECDAALSA